MVYLQDILSPMAVKQWKLFVKPFSYPICVEFMSSSYVIYTSISTWERVVGQLDSSSHDVVIQFY